MFCNVNWYQLTLINNADQGCESFNNIIQYVLLNVLHSNQVELINIQCGVKKAL